MCDELLQSVIEQGYTTPSPIQIEGIPAVLEQRDVMAVSRTGTGKTACFVLPILQLLNSDPRATPRDIRTLIITPTRELAAQVTASIQTYSKHLDFRALALCGGVRIGSQISQLNSGVDIVVATPGRLIDLHKQNAINFDKLEIVVLDEADRMLDLGFIDDIRHIQSLLPAKRQTLLFSATFSKAVKLFANQLLVNHYEIEATEVNSTASSITQLVHPVDKTRKTELLVHLIKKNRWSQVLVFSGTKHGADHLVLKLQKAGVSSACIHANRTQRARTTVLDGFKDGSINVLIATDIASRGLDIKQLSCVINYDLPYVPEDYVHRIGRTGRAQNSGIAISLYSEDELKQLQTIERFIGQTFKQEIVRGFTPTEKQPVVESDDDLYGNFEPNSNSKRKGNGRGKLRRR